MTQFLSRWTPQSNLTVSVQGFGGEDDTRFVDTEADLYSDDIVVVAGGVGITPFMAQEHAAHESGLALTVLWTLRAEDLALAVNVIEGASRRGIGTTVFVTGEIDADGSTALDTLERLGTRTVTRRLRETDVMAVGSAGRRRFYVCAGPALRRAVVEWVTGEDVRVEPFDY